MPGLLPCDAAHDQSEHPHGHGTYGARFGRAEKSGQYAPHNDKNEQDDGNNALERTELFLHGIRSSARQKIRSAAGHEEKKQNEHAGEHESGHHSGHEQLSGRRFCDDGIDDETEAGRDKHAQCAAAGQAGAGEGGVVPLLAHFRQSHGSHGHACGQAVAANGGKARASGNTGDAERGRGSSHPDAGRAEHVAADPGTDGKFAHKTEKRYYCHGGGERGVVGSLAQRVELGDDVRVQAKQAEESGNAHGITERKTEEKNEHETRHAEDSQLRAGDIHRTGFENPRQSGGQRGYEQDGGKLEKLPVAQQHTEFFKTVDQQHQSEKAHAAAEEKHGNEERNMHDRSYFSARSLFRSKAQNLPAQHGEENKPREFKQCVQKALQTGRKPGVKEVDGDMLVTAGDDDHAADREHPHHKFLDFKGSGEIRSGVAQHNVQRHRKSQKHERSRAQSQACL